jgi:hypothetical protein
LAGKEIFDSRAAPLIGTDFALSGRGSGETEIAFRGGARIVRRSTERKEEHDVRIATTGL